MPLTKKKKKNPKRIRDLRSRLLRHQIQQKIKNQNSQTGIHRHHRHTSPNTESAPSPPLSRIRSQTTKLRITPSIRAQPSKH